MHYVSCIYLCNVHYAYLCKECEKFEELTSQDGIFVEVVRHTHATHTHTYMYMYTLMCVCLSLVIGTRSLDGIESEGMADASRQQGC